MTMTSTEAGARAFPRTNAKHWVGVTADDIPQGWMDDMVRRLFDVLNRSMIRLEKATGDPTDTDGTKLKKVIDEATRTTRLANQMQTALERLTEMETKRVRNRKPNLAKSDDEALEDLERRITELAAAARASRNS